MSTPQKIPKSPHKKQNKTKKTPTPPPNSVENTKWYILNWYFLLGNAYEVKRQSTDHQYLNMQKKKSLCNGAIQSLCIQINWVVSKQF